MNRDKRMLYDENEQNVVDINVQPDSNVNSEKTSAHKGKWGADKKLKNIGLAFVVASVVLFVSSFSGTTVVNTSEEAMQALEQHVSTQLEIGVRISSEDEYYAGEDVTIAHSSQLEETVIYVWDYAAEDGDYVQILVDGVAIGEPFMIVNSPVEYTVPTVGEIQVLGTRDGGGGITYAVHYELNGTTYFNGMDVGNGNLYTLIRE